MSSATDLLLEIKESVDKLLKYYQNQDNTLKLILARLNKTPIQSNDGSVAQQAKPIEIKRPQSEFAKNAAAVGVVVDEPVVERPSVKKPAEKKVSVGQVLQYENGSLTFAEVKISSGGSLVKTVRTSTKGRWNASLEPGHYEISVNKSFQKDSGRAPISASYTIDVTKSDEPIELETKQLR